MSRFDYVKYDEIAYAKSAELKAAFQAYEAGFLSTLEAMEHVESLVMDLPEGRGKALAREKLLNLAGMKAQQEKILATVEEVYMWCGKAIRDDQVETRGAELQEARNNG